MKVQITAFALSEPAIRSIRDTVFGQEQKIARQVDWDGQDPEGIHAVAIEEDGTSIGTGRLLSDGRVGRLAVLEAYRGRGVGGAILDTLVARAREKGLDRVYLHAQADAVPFYAKRAFCETGERFVEADIPHVIMTRNLDV